MIVASIEGREKSLKKLVSSIQNFNEDYDYKIIIIRQYKNQKFVMKNNKVNLININEFGASNARNIGLRVVKKMIEKNKLYTDRMYNMICDNSVQKHIIGLRKYPIWNFTLLPKHICNFVNYLERNKKIIQEELIVRYSQALKAVL